ncbi:MAG: neutral/alkaline non-lysosomal ceramidase N-terminal domain-containing protein [Propionicimonas sp.]|nr:neutral/alkaline non-lysosomal ceramidase N-terminal domain-containing protein [Propionicimonas sp.]
MRAVEPNAVRVQDEQVARGEPFLTAARVDITPPVGVALGGYRMRARASSGVHRPLEANAVVLRADDGWLAVVSIDVLAITRTLRESVVQAICESQNLPNDRILVVATHTHSAPASWAGTIMPSLPALVDPAECQRVAHLVAAAFASASRDPQPAVGSALSVVAGVGGDRNDPSLGVDSSVGVSAFFGGHGDVACTIFDYACHATVLGPENLSLSPDWVGAARDSVRTAFGQPHLPVVFLPGAAGNISARFQRRDRSPHEADRLGAVVGTAVASAAMSMSSAPVDRLLVTSMPLRAHARAPLPVDIVEARGPGATPRARPATLGSGHDEPPVLGRASLVRINDSRTLFVPFELTNGLGELLRDEFAGLRIATCADGYLGYLADAGEHRGGRYEAEVSYFDHAETERLVAQLRQTVIRAS